MFNRAYNERKLSVRHSRKVRGHLMGPMVHWGMLITVLSAVMFFSK